MSALDLAGATMDQLFFGNGIAMEATSRDGDEDERAIAQTEGNRL